MKYLLGVLTRLIKVTLIMPYIFTVGLFFILFILLVLPIHIITGISIIKLFDYATDFYLENSIIKWLTSD